MRVSWNWQTVSELQKSGILLVEDGNHGEYRPRPSEFTEDGVAFIRAADMNDGRVEFGSASKINDIARARITKGIGAPGDILLSHKGTVGKVAIVRDDAPPFVCSPQTTFWRTLRTDVLDRRFLHAYLRSPAFHAQLRAVSGETDMAPYASLTSQRSLRVPLRPIDEQRTIGRIIGAFDAKIELNRRMNETLEAMARALFKSWFVDFDPVRAKAEGRAPSGMDAETAKLFPSEFAETKLGQIPKGWRCSNVGEHVELIRGTTYTGALVGKPGPALLGLGSIRPGGGFRYNGFKTYGGECPPELTLKPGDVYVSLKGATKDGEMIGSVARVPASIPAGRITQDTVKLAFRNPTVSHFMYLHLLTPEYRSYCANRAMGSAVVALSRHDFLSYPLVLPPDGVLNRFTKLASELNARAELCFSENVALAATRDALLPKLLSGELSVAQAERTLEATA